MQTISVDTIDPKNGLTIVGESSFFVGSDWIYVYMHTTTRSIWFLPKKYVLRTFAFPRRQVISITMRTEDDEDEKKVFELNCEIPHEN